MKKQILFLVVLAFILRIIFIPQGAVSFHYDMSRDAYEAQQIWRDKNLKIQGPKTTQEGLFSGVLYYYLLAIPYSIGKGDPKVAAIFLSLINSLAVIPVYLLALDLFKTKRLSFLAGLFFVSSFEVIQYGPWLSNPSPAIFTIAMFFYSLRLWQKNYKLGLLLGVIFAALSTQLELFLAYLFIVILAFKLLFTIKTQIKLIFLSTVISLVILSSFIVSMIKFNTYTKTFLGLLSISQSANIGFRTKFTDLISIYINRFTDLFINNFFPINVFIGGILALIVLFVLIQKIKTDPYKFILFCLLSNLPIFLFGGQNATYTTVGMVVPAIMGVSLFLQNIFRINRFFAVSLIVFIIVSNLYMTFKTGTKGQILLVIPKDMVLKNQLLLIDKTYDVAQEQPFSINSLTLPLWTNTTWAYLYSWYGKEKYGYVPSFYGRDQVDLLGEKSLPKVEKPQPISFFIIEPLDGIPANFSNSELETENSKTTLQSETSYGSLKLQFRKPKNEDQ